MKVFLCTTLAVVLFAETLYAESQDAPEIVVQQSIPISTDEPGVHHVESWLAVNPRDPQNLIAALIGNCFFSSAL